MKASEAERSSGAGAYERLLRAIEEGELAPGSRLREAELAERFQISRTPVREALGRLEAQGLVAHEPHRGASVAQLDYGQVSELYDLREDPDVILVGEMRDLETIRLALGAAETGHLVFGTLHTSSAAKTIDRVVDVFPAAEKDMVRSMLSESLQSVISQTLLKKPGGGRVAAHEIMMGTSAIRNLIREDKVAQMYSAIQTGASVGMQTLDQCLKDLLAKGMVTREEAKMKAKKPFADFAIPTDLPISTKSRLTGAPRWERSWPTRK